MASIRKLKSGKYQATVYKPNGQRVTRTHVLRRVVSDWAAQTESRLRLGTYTEPKDGRTTLSEWWDRWQSVRRVEVATADKNESQWRNHVRPRFGTWPLSSISSWEVEAWVTDMGSSGVGAETVASSLRLLRLMLAEAVRHRLIPANPAELVKAPTPPKHVDRYVSRDEADRILAQVEGRDWMFVSLMFECGLRWSEASAVRGWHVDLMRRQLNVQKAQRRDGTDKDPKTEAGTRPVPLTDDLVAALSEYMAGRDRDERLFQGETGGALSYTNWRRRVWVPAVVRAKLADPQPTPHDARHAYGSWLGEAGMPQAQIAALMGHGTTRSTERYVHATPARMEQAREALDATKINKNGKLLRTNHARA